MPLPFDAPLKALVQSHPADFEAILRLHGPGPATVLNVDLATVSAATDVTLGYGDPPTLLVDLNFQASRDANLPGRLLLYNALLHHRFGAPVHSIVILLRPEADTPTLTGRSRFQALPRRGSVDFRYEVVRLWELRPDGCWPAGRARCRWPSSASSRKVGRSRKVWPASLPGSTAGCGDKPTRPRFGGC